MNFKSYLFKIFPFLNRNNKFVSDRYKISYSQHGEDQIILTLLFLLQIRKANFIDIGANDPYQFNNTALLNEKDIHGINIEPDPENLLKLNRFRNKDINLNVGISNRDGVLKYYRFADSVYNTFSETEFNKLKDEKNGLSTLPTLNVNVTTYNSIVETYLNGKPPVILFMDTEGFDELIIDSINYEKYAPVILCVETFAFGSFKKDEELINKIIQYGYTVHADTFLNTIFVKSTFLPFKKVHSAPAS